MELIAKDVEKNKPGKGKKSLAPQKEVPQECVGESFKLEQGARTSAHHPHASVCHPLKIQSTRCRLRDENSRKAAQPQIKRS